MSKLLIVGIGSRIMTDDGIGIYIVEALKGLDDGLDIDYIIGETDVDYCLDVICGYNNIMIIDAYLSGKEPGSVTVIPLEDIKKCHEGGLSMHGLHLIDTLKHSTFSSSGILIGIEPCELDFGFELSNTLKSCYPDVLRNVSSEISIYLESL